MHCESRDFLPEGLLLESRNFRISVHRMFPVSTHETN